MRKIDTKIIADFISDQEVKILEDYILNNVYKIDSYHEGDHPMGTSGVPFLYAHYFVFDFYDPARKIITDILAPKFAKVFGPELYIQQIHIFNSVNPYSIHTDVDSGGPINPKAPVPAWTFIIPLDDFDSHTITFNQEQDIKIPEEYIKNNPPMDQPSIDEETRLKYFSHIPMSMFHWFTVEDIFKWKKGSLFAASRRKFHTSDNFLDRGLKYKRAIVAWTSLPEDDSTPQ